jgi:hypothetical protein
VPDAFDVWFKLEEQPSPAAIRDASRLLKLAEPIFELLEKATRKPRCWFNFNWSNGPFQRTPEYYDLRRFSQLLKLKSLVEACQGSQNDVANCLHEIFVIADHANQDGTVEGMSESMRIYESGLKDLGLICIQHPNVVEYQRELTRALSNQPKPDVHRLVRMRLWTYTTAMDWSDTEDGRKRMGFARSFDVDRANQLFSLVRSKSQARISVVKAIRDFWGAINLPQPQRSLAMAEADKRRDEALRAFPWLVNTYASEGYGYDTMTLEAFQSLQLVYKAVLRAVSSGTVATTIKTSDLLSPFDGSPLSYKFDGKEVTIVATSYGTSRTTKFSVGSSRH